jgi:hypothetical protein
MPQQEAGEVLPCLAQNARRCGARANKIAHRFVGSIGHPNSGQFSGPVQPGQHRRVAPVGLYPVAGLPRNQRRSNHRAVLAKPAQ